MVIIALAVFIAGQRTEIYAQTYLQFLQQKEGLNMFKQFLRLDIFIIIMNFNTSNLLEC